MTFRGAKGGSSSFHQTPDNLRSNDTFEGVLGLCVGPIKGPTRGLKSITLNDTAIENETGESNFTDFLAVLGDGDPLKFPQAVSLKLGAGSAPQSVGVQFSNTGSPVWVTKTLTSTNADFVDMRFIAQQLFRQDSKGIYNETATIEIQMKPVGSSTWINPTLNTPTGSYNEQGVDISSNGSFIRAFFPQEYFNFITGGGNWKPASPNYVISGKTNSAAVYELRIGLPNTGPYANTQWDIRARMLEVQTYDDGNGNTQQRNIQWESIAAVFSGQMMTHEDCRGVAWLQLYGKASDQLTGVPEVDGEYDTKIVSVPSSAIYNASTRVYTAGVWDGSWNKAFTTDPAWIINDAISDSLSGLSLVAQGSYMNKWDCLEASKWFSEQVPDGNGGTHCRYSMNITVSSPQKGDEFIQYLAGACGGLAYDEGNGQWRMKVDKPDTPVDIFTLDNIENEFVYAHTDVDTQFNDIIGQFKNAEMDYRDDAVRLYDNTAIAKNGRKPTTIALVGCTNRQEAMRRVKLRLRSTINENRMVSFTTNRRGRNVDPLSLILVADGDLGDSAAKTTGRGNASGTVLTFRDPIYLSSGPNYDIVYSVPNPNYDPDKTTQPTSADWKKPTITKKARISTASSNFDQSRTSFTVIAGDAFPADLPVDFAFAIDAVGLPTMPVAYRVMSVTPDEDGERIAITAINVDTGKWAAADGVTKEDTVFTDLRGAVPAPLPPISGTVLTVARRLVDIGTQVTLSANWIRPSALMLSHFMIKWRVNGGAWTTEDRIFLPPFELSNPAAGIYDFEIYSVDRNGGVSNPLMASLTVDATAVGEVLELAQDVNGLISDSILAGGEKGAVIIDQKAVVDNYNALNAKYVSLGSPAGLTTVRGNAASAVSALNTYLTGLSPAWNDTTQDTPITPATYRTKWGDAYNTLALFTAAITGQPGANGTSALNGYLTNESQTLPALADGTITTYAGAGGLFKVFLGTTDVSSSCSFAVAAGGNPQGLTGSAANGVYNATTGEYNITGGFDASEQSAILDLVATHNPTGATITKRFSLSKSVSGSNGTPGAPAPLLDLDTTHYTYGFSTANLPFSQTTSFTAIKQNITGSPLWSLKTIAGATLIGPSSASYMVSTGYFGSSGPDNLTLTETNFNTLIIGNGTNGLIIEASLSGLADHVSVIKVKDGTAGVNGQSVVVQGSTNGTSWHTGLQTGDIYMRVSNDSGATYGATVLIRGEAGTPGVSDYTSFVFKRATSAPSTPTDNTGDPPSGWTDTAPAGNDPVWMSKAEFRISYGQLTSWSTPIRVDGTDGAQAWTANSLGGPYTRSGGSFTAIGNVNVQTVEKFPQARISCQVTGFNENTGLGFVDPTTGYPYEFILIGAWGSDVRKHHGGVVQTGTGVAPANGQLWELVHQGTEIIGYIDGVNVGVVATGVPADRALQGQFHMSAGVTLNNITFSRAGAAGTSARTVSVTSNSVSVAADYNGTVKSGELPKSVGFKVMNGTTDVTASSSFARTDNSGNIATSLSGNILSLNTMTGDSSTDVVATYAGVALPSVRVQWTRIKDPAPPAATTSVSAGYTPNTYAGGSFSSAPGANTVLIQSPASGAIKITTNGYYAVQTPANGSRSVTFYFTIGYRVAGSGSGWTLLSEQPGDLAFATNLISQNEPPENSPGGWSLIFNASGLTNAQTYEFGLFQRVYSGTTGAMSAWPGGSVLAAQN